MTMFLSRDCLLRSSECTAVKTALRTEFVNVAFVATGYNTEGEATTAAYDVVESVGAGGSADSEIFTALSVRLAASASTANTLTYCIIHCIFLLYCISIIHCIFTFICIFICSDFSACLGL